MTNVPATVVPWRKLTMTEPSTSVCPVAVTVLGNPKPSKSPCAISRPGANKSNDARRVKNFDFILRTAPAVNQRGEVSKCQPGRHSNVGLVQKPVPTEAGNGSI